MVGGKDTEGVMFAFCEEQLPFCGPSSKGAFGKEVQEKKRKNDTGQQSCRAIQTTLNKWLAGASHLNPIKREPLWKLITCLN